MNSIQHQAMNFAQIASSLNIKGHFQQTTRQQLQPVIDMLKLSNELVTWYEIASPVDIVLPWSGNDLILYNPLELVEHQGGYRWQHDNPGNLFEGWNTNWIVIGDMGADPIIADVGHAVTSVSMAIHGIGVWQPVEVAPEIGTFLEVLTAWLKVSLERHKGLANLYDNSWIILPQVKQDLIAEFSKLIDDQHVTNLMSFIE